MSVAISLSESISIPDDVLHRSLGDELVLLNIDSGRYFGLDSVGASMWHALDKADTMESACQALLAEFDVDEEELRSDLKRLVGDLSSHGLLNIASSTDRA